MSRSMRAAQSPVGEEPTSAVAVSEGRGLTFLRLMSHELRTPLNSIIGFSDILASELYGPLGSPEYKEYAQIIGESGYRLLNLVNNALEIMRLESGVAALELEAVPLTDVVDDAWQKVVAEAHERQVSLSFTPPDPPMRVLGDARGLVTAVFNLLRNAVTWSPPGGAVEVKLRCEGTIVRLEISDCGDGVDAKELDRLMRPFEQGDAGLSRSHDGAGLGWPLVRLLAEAMGGTFEVDPRPGHGLRAIVTLRRAG